MEIINNFCKENITPTQLKNEVLKNDLSAFIHKTFNTINPGVKYLHNWHIDLIAEYLKEVYNGNIKRLIINIPPRSLKSVCVSVAFPAWVLGQKPYSRIIVASYSEILSLKHSTDCRIVVSSKWFQKLFKDFQLNQTQNEKHKFATTQNGYRFATSIGGSLTGEGGDILIVDDPHNPQQIMSEKYRTKTLEWFSNTFVSRLNNKKDGVIIIVMQRLHQNDLSGYLLEKSSNEWTLLSIPAIAEKTEYYNIGDFSKIRQKGEILHSKREGLKEIERIKQDMGSYIFSAQYQQKPIVKEGNMIKANWLKKYDYSIEPEKIFLSFDTAIKAGINNDPTVCTVWGEFKNNLYLLNVYREWLEYPELKRRSIEIINKYQPNAILIEDKASGQSLIQDLKKEIKLPIIPIKVSKDKITRLASVSPYFEANKILLPKEATWLIDYENELYSFPFCEHDDQVDSTSQFLQWYKNNSNINKEIRVRKI